MKSMTGYGEARIKSGKAEISAVVKSVNGRFFEPRLHLPKEYFQYEVALKKLLAGIFSRGTVDVFIVRRTSVQQYQVNLELARVWVGAQKKLAQAFSLPDENSHLIDRLMALPNIMESTESKDVHEQEKENLFKAVKKAAELCEKERLREGLSLKVNLKDTLKEFYKVVHQMERDRERANQELKNRILERLKKIGLESEVEPSRFAQELVFYLDKCDITEEIERLKEHLAMCEKYLSLKEEQGKKLDFYSQELLREVNTIGSKANSAAITQHVVKAKGLIEIFKEQVQNIE